MSTEPVYENDVATTERPTLDQLRDTTLSFIANLVDYPDESDVTFENRGNSTIMTLHVHPEDAGKVIGKNGSTANALRHLISNFGYKYRKRFIFEVVKNNIITT